MPKTDPKTAHIAQGYSQALLSVAKSEGLVDQVEEELTALGDAFSSDSRLQAFLDNPKVTSEGKRDAISELLGKQVSRITSAQISLAIEQERGALLPSIIEQYFKLTAESRKKLTAKVITAVPLSDAASQNIESTLSELVGEPVFLKASVDPEILGGITVHLAGRIIDGSLKNRLEHLREGLSRKILTEKGEAS